MGDETSAQVVSTYGKTEARKRPDLTNAKERLLLGLQLGEEEAFRELVTQQQGLLIRIAMRHVATREAAEEVVQETWMTVFTSIDQFEGRSSLRAWICGILIHKAKDRGVREKRYAHLSGFEGHGDNHDWKRNGSIASPDRNCVEHWSISKQLTDDRTPEKLLLSKQAVDCVQRAMDALPLHLKEVLILRDTDGMTTNEVCKRLNISETNLYVRLHRARERVRTAVVKASLGGHVRTNPGFLLTSVLPLVMQL